MAAGSNKTLQPETISPFPELAPAAPPSASIRSFFLQGPAGRLEALLNEGDPDAPYVTLLCHPHPLGGGTMHNKVVYHAAKVFSSLGWPVLRFNFRGTGLSEGTHHGTAEVEDVQAGLDWLSQQYDQPIVAAGFSFGAATGLQAACHYPRVQGFAALGLPTEAQGRKYTHPSLPMCHFPKLFLSGDQDQFAPASQLREIFATAAEPKEIVLLSQADHFFVGKLHAMQTSLNEWITNTFLPRQDSGNRTP